MRRPSARPLYLAAMAAALALPSLGWLGLRGLVTAHGFETPDVAPRLTPANVRSGRFQKDFATHFEHVFFGRTEMLFLKNGLHDLANFGDYHAGFSGHVIQGKDGWLFEKPYLDVAFRTPLPIESPREQRAARQALAHFRSACAAAFPNGSAPPFAVLLAPSKAEALRDKAPARYAFFAERPAPAPGAAPEPYAAWRALLAAARVPFVDAADLADPAADPRTLFPYGGTHWTVHYAARCVSAALAAAAPSLPRPEPLPPTLAPGPDDPRDRDLAHLLNVPIPYRRHGDLHAHAAFPPAAPSGRRILLLGDSFGEQAKAALVRSGLYAPEDVLLFFNRIPPARAFRDAMARADAVLFVWSAPSLANRRVQETLDALANHLAPAVKPARRYALAGSPYAMDPAWTPADGGHTAELAPGRTALLELPLAGRPPGAAPTRAAVTLFSADGAALPPLPVPCEPGALTNGAVLRVPVAAPAGAPLRLTAFRLDLQ